MVGFPAWVMNISIMEHFAGVPAESLAVWPLVVSAIVAVVTFIVGAAVWRNRDLMEN